MSKTNKSTSQNEQILYLINGDTLTIEAGVVIITDAIGMSFETENVQYFVPFSSILYLKQYDDPTAAAAESLLVYEAAIG